MFEFAATMHLKRQVSMGSTHLYCLFEMGYLGFQSWLRL